MRCPLCGYTENDYDEEEIRAGTWRCVCGYVHPVPGAAEVRADAARLRALLRELVEGQNRPGHWCTYCGEYQAGTYSSHDGHGVIIKHTDDCPVRRARAEVGGDEA